MESLAIIAPEIWRHALDTFGTEERVRRWMDQPLAELGNRTAGQMLQQDPHSKEVEAVLTRIDYGVYG